MTALISKAEYDALAPRTQGYVCYMQAALTGSEIPDRCPYRNGTKNALAWQHGLTAAMLAVQEGEG